MIYQSEYFKDAFSTKEMREVFSDKKRIQAWLDTEVAIAKAQANLKIIPKFVVKEISKAANVKNFNLEKMKKDYLKVGFPIIPLLNQLKNLCSKESSRWIHWGATTQDIIDTGMVLQMRQGFIYLQSDLEKIMNIISRLVKKHQNTVMPGRTFQQHASPITFGYKAAIWLDELLRHQKRLFEIKKRVFVCSYGGAVGNLSSLGNHGIKVINQMSKELKLAPPNITWHSSRDRWADIIYWLSLVTTTTAKIANEISILMRTEIAEVREPYFKGKGASSTMPQKQNPTICPIIIAISNRLRDTLPIQLSAMLQEHERSTAGQPTEWLSIPETFILTSGALNQTKRLLTGLQINKVKMKTNLDFDNNGFIMSESVMMGLAKKIGRSGSHKIITEVVNRSIKNNTSLFIELNKDKKILAHLSYNDIIKLLKPENYLGVSSKMIQRVLLDFNNYRK